jgi:hypothetical protein
LRRKGILQWGAGLTNKEALNFFTSLQNLPHGSCCARTMVEIDSYRANRRMQTNVHAFFHKKKKTIRTVLSTIVAVVSIFGTLVGILVKLKSPKAAPRYIYPWCIWMPFCSKMLAPILQILELSMYVLTVLSTCLFLTMESSNCMPVVYQQDWKFFDTILVWVVY